jgi:energy-converting hydrogenase A subunit R
MPNRFFATDCEGPISKNDNALELAEHFLPRGESFFSRVSKYDDFLADVEKRPGYRAGDTLKLILPFFKAFGVTEKDMEAFSRDHILLLPRARETLNYISSLMPCYIISTSYTPYIRALCRAIGHPEAKAFSTEAPLDQFPILPLEKDKLKELEEEIAALPLFDWPAQAGSLEDLEPRDRKCIERLNRIFWEDIASWGIGRLLTEITPVGGEEKALALKKISAIHNLPLSQAFYAGDSITDVQVFQEVNRAGGLTLAINGNAYAVREARMACLSANSLPLAILAETFLREGLEGALASAGHWERKILASQGIRLEWLDALFPVNGAPATELHDLSEGNREEVSRKSTRFRKEIRGERIGGLG